MSQQEMDGYKSAFIADGYCVENKNFSSRECRGEKYLWRTVRIVPTNFEANKTPTNENSII